MTLKKGAVIMTPKVGRIVMRVRPVNSGAVIMTPKIGRVITSLKSGKILMTLKAAGAFCAEYQAWLDRLTALGYTHPPTNVKYAQNQLVLDLIAAGLWDRCRYMRLLHSGSVQTATVNLKAPTLNQLTIPNGDPTFTEGGGCRSNGATYFRDPFNIDTGISQNNHCVIMYVSQSSAANLNQYLHGGNMGGSVFFALQPRNGTGVYYHFTTTPASSTVVSPNHKALWVHSSRKPIGAGSDLWRDGVKTSSAVALANPFFSTRLLLALDNNAATGQPAQGHYTLNVALDAAFDAFDAADELAFQTIWNTYKTNSGLP